MVFVIVGVRCLPQSLLRQSHNRQRSPECSIVIKRLRNIFALFDSRCWSLPTKLNNLKIKKFVKIFSRQKFPNLQQSRCTVSNVHSGTLYTT